MNRPTTHGAASAAADSSSSSSSSSPNSQSRRRLGASPSPSRLLLNRSSSGSRSPSGGRRNNGSWQESTGLLSAEGNTDHGDDDGGRSDRESGVLVPSTTSSFAGTPSSSRHRSPDPASHSRSGGQPRTPNRVRFDLTPTFVDANPRRSSEAGGNNGFSSSSSASPRPSNPNNNNNDDADDDDDDRYPRESFDLDDADPLRSPASQHRREQRLPLLTGIEAPSVTVSESSYTSHSGHQHIPHFHTVADAEAWAAEERARPKSSLPAAFMNMANSIIGAGIIGQPYAMRQAGLLSGVILLVVLTVVVDWTIRLIVVNAKLSGAGSFQGTVERCFGRTGLIAISLAQWAFAFGGMVAFGVIVGDSIPSVLRAIWPGLKDMPVLGLLADRRAVIVVFTLGVSYPLALYRDIAKLAKASTLALLSMAVIVATVVVQGALAPAEERGELKDWKMLVINDGIFQAIGVISFAFVCHHNSLLIYGSLEKPTIDRFACVTHFSTGISMLACLLLALSGFLTFGDRTQGNVLNNFSQDNTMANVARLCFGLNMLTTLPLEAFVCREVMLNYYFPGEPFNMNLHLIFTSSLVFSAMVLSLLTCDLGTVFDLVGGTSAAAMAYILPPLCYVKLTKRRDWRTYAAWAVAAFGGTVMVMSMLQAIGQMIRGEGETKQCY